MIHISRHYLHTLLCEFKMPQSSTSKLFSKKPSNLRVIIKTLSAEGRKYDHLNEEEMNHLIEAIRLYVTSNHLSSDSVDNLMLHHMMCKYLFMYELDYTSTNLIDEFKLVIDEYFLKINNELELLPTEILSESSHSSLLIWLECLTNKPSLYLTHLWIAGDGNEYGLQHLELEECGCVDASHDRLFGRVRLQIEKLVLQECENTVSETTPLKLLSMGPGAALQDFIIVFKLLNKGIRNIELTLVEPEYESLLAAVDENTKAIYCRGLPEGSPLPEKYYLNQQKKIYSIIRAISLLSRCYEDANIGIYQYHSIEDLKQDVEIVAPYDLVYAIDFENYTEEKAREDFYTTANYLKADGHAFLSTHNQIMIFEVTHENQYKEIERIEHERIKREADGYHQLNDISNFFTM